MTVGQIRVKFLGTEPSLPNYIFMAIVLTSGFAILLGMTTADVDMILMSGCTLATSISAARLNYVNVEHTAYIAVSGLIFLLAALASELLEPLVQ